MVPGPWPLRVRASSKGVGREARASGQEQRRGRARAHTPGVAGRPAAVSRAVTPALCPRTEG